MSKQQAIPASGLKTNNKNQGNGIARNGNPVPVEVRNLLKAAKTPKWILGRHIPNLEIQPSHELAREHMSIVIATPNKDLIQLVLHRPIGVTDLPQDEFILSTATEVQELLSRKEDPGAEHLQARRAEFVMEALIRSNFLYRKEDNELYYTGIDTQLSRRVLLNKLRKNELDAKSADLVKRAEDNLKTYKVSNNLMLEAEKVYPSSFKTASGPLWDRLQRPVPYLKGKNLDEATQVLIRNLYGYHDKPELKVGLQWPRYSALNNESVNGTEKRVGSPPRSPPSFSEFSKNV